MDRIRTFKQGQTWPPLTGRLTFDGGRQYMDLGPQAGVTSVELRARGVGNRALITGTVDILDTGDVASRGSWSWTPTPEDTQVVDLYDIEFVITYGPGEVEIVPESGHGQFAVESAL